MLPLGDVALDVLREVPRDLVPNDNISRSSITLPDISCEKTTTVGLSIQASKEKKATSNKEQIRDVMLTHLSENAGVASLIARSTGT